MAEEYVSRQYLLDEYDRQHHGPPGGARKIIAGAPAADVAHVKEVEEAYQNGLNKAWDAAHKIESLSAREFETVFTGYNDCFEVFENYTPQEVIEKIGQYERVKEKYIQVGDEVERYGDRGIITKISDDGDHFNVMWENGSTGYIIGDFKKTGRNFPEIAEVFRKMVRT